MPAFSSKGTFMFGIGSTELLVILVVALIVLGPGSLARVSRSLGKMVGEFRRVSTDFQRTLNVEAAEQEARERRAAREAKERAAKQSHSSSASTQAEQSPDIAPADSPIGQAVAKAKAEAAGLQGPEFTPQSADESKHGA